MIDRQHAILTVVESIRKEPDTITHAMELSPSLKPF